MEKMYAKAIDGYDTGMGMGRLGRCCKVGELVGARPPARQGLSKFPSTGLEIASSRRSRRLRGRSASAGGTRPRFPQPRRHGRPTGVETVEEPAVPPRSAER